MNRTSLAILATAFLSGTAAAQCPLPPSGVGLAGGDGASGAVWGDTAIVGDPSNERALLFERNQGGPGQWGNTATLVASDGFLGDEFGGAVAVHADRAVVGAFQHGNSLEGAVYLFERNAGGPDAWGEVEKLSPRTMWPQFAEFGHSVAVYGNTILVGAPDLTLNAFHNAGGVFVFEYDPELNEWFQAHELQPPTIVIGDRFGASVALYEDTAAIGEPGDGLGWFPGSVFLHERGAGGPGNWGKVKRVRASDLEPDAFFGAAVDLHEDTLLVGSPEHDHGGVQYVGAAYVFERDLGGTDQWGERQELLHPAPIQQAYFADSVALHAGVAVAATRQGFAAKDEAHVFERDAGVVDQWSLSGSASHANLLEAFLEDATLLLVGSTGSEVRALVPTQAFERYCTAGTSSNGCRATVSACGAASATAPTGFLLQVAGTDGARNGRFFFGSNGRQATPWGNGTSYQCVVPPLKRAPAQTTSGSIGACDGTVALDLNAHWSNAPPHNPGSGALVRAQFYVRDPASTSNQTSSLSDAIEFLVNP